MAYTVIDEDSGHEYGPFPTYSKARMAAHQFDRWAIKDTWDFLIDTSSQADLRQVVL